MKLFLPPNHAEYIRMQLFNRSMFSLLVSKGRFKKLSHLNINKWNPYSTVSILPYGSLWCVHIFNSVHLNKQSKLSILCLADLDNICSWETQELVWHKKPGLEN